MKICYKTALGLLLAVAVFSGCGQRGAMIVNLAGSTSVQPLAELLAETYMKKHPGVTVNVQGGGSSAGIEAVTQEVVNIGLSSRPLNDKEKALIPYKIAFDAVAIIVHPTNKIKGLKISELQKIYSGEYKKWNQVFAEGKNKDIDVVTREEGSGTRDAFVKMVLGDKEVTPSAIVQDATGVVREIVASDKEAIGYISLGIADERVKVLAIDGVRPSLGTVLKNQYKITRPFLFVLKKKPQGEVKNFLDYVISPAAQKMVRESGFVPIR